MQVPGGAYEYFPKPFDLDHIVLSVVVKAFNSVIPKL